MDDIERMIAGIAIRRTEAGRAEEPVRALLLAIIDQQENELAKMRARDAES